MMIQTRDFGEIEIDAQEMITMRSAIYGFEELTQFVLLYDDGIDAPFSWLQSAERRDICFILIDPFVVLPDYAPQLPAGDRTMLTLGAEEPVYRAIMVIPETGKGVTVNLKSPIVINPIQKCAAQVILEEDYPVRARLMVGEESV